jgi:hypothetical protein
MSAMESLANSFIEFLLWIVLPLQASPLELSGLPEA